jgi:hypothetical protein
MGGMKQSVPSRRVGSLTGKWHLILPNLKDCKRSEACLHSGYNRVELSRFAVAMGI